MKAKMKTLEEMKRIGITCDGQIHFTEGTAWVNESMYHICGTVIELSKWSDRDRKGKWKGFTITRPMLEWVDAEMNRNGANS